MKIKFIGLIFFLLITFFIFSEEDKKIELKNQKEKASYSLGYDLGTKLLKTDGLDIDLDVFLSALKVGAKGENPIMTASEMENAIAILQQELSQKQQERLMVLAEKNKKDGDLFLENNKKKEGVITLASGLQYKVITAGTGKSPKETDTVTVHYKGMTIEGNEFDSSYSRNQPATFGLNQVIKGWTEGLQYLKEGGKMMLYVPSDLGYGERGAGEVILPNSTLIFEIELLKIEESK